MPSRLTPTAAIIIPAYNAARTLPRTLDSAVRSVRFCQDQGLAIEPEIIVVDDRSTDDTPAIARQWSVKDPFIKLITNADNRGPGFSRNEGVRQSSAQHLFFSMPMMCSMRTTFTFVSRRCWPTTRWVMFSHACASTCPCTPIGHPRSMKAARSIFVCGASGTIGSRASPKSQISVFIAPRTRSTECVCASSLNTRRSM
ncbi:MAG: glycosyltransferase family 2 protein [Rhodospirillaceae bacterium]|nr:glycosyltransferase family 2 protein [Rhodospirillaceae bacterium]